MIRFCVSEVNDILQIFPDSKTIDIFSTLVFVKLLVYAILVKVIKICLIKLKN